MLSFPGQPVFLVTLNKRSTAHQVPAHAIYPASPRARAPLTTSWGDMARSRSRQKSSPQHLAKWQKSPSGDESRAKRMILKQFVQKIAIEGHRGTLYYTFPLHLRAYVRIPPARFERARTAPEAAALSTELRGRKDSLPQTPSLVQINRHHPVPGSHCVSSPPSCSPPHSVM